MSGKFKYFAIFGSMRSGSNLLEQSLNQFSGITCHGELFNPAFIGQPKNREFLGIGHSEREISPKKLIKAMITDAGEGIAGFRVFQGHDPRVTQIALRDHKCAKIILQRDTLDSFISLEIARETDQWLLNDALDRRSRKITFNAEGYENYCAEQELFYAEIQRALQETGQTAFWVRYPEQRNINVINGIAKFLGYDETLKTSKVTIRRQNPESLREKVENYDEMISHVTAKAELSRYSPSSFDPMRRANIPKMVSCLSKPILFLPTPGGPNEEVLRWMSKIDGNDISIESYIQSVFEGSILHTGHNQRTLFEWMEANPDVTALTAIRHPIPRAYDVFMSKIFTVGTDTYSVIREQLVKYYGLAVPDPETMEGGSRAAMESGGYSIGQHRAAFHTFLRFLKNNLAGQTSIRVDGLWNTQIAFLSGFNTVVPISVVIKQGQMDAGFRYVESILDLPTPELGSPIRPNHMFTLDDIYSRQTENLARKAYSVDYTRFGFGDYQAAFEA